MKKLDCRDENMKVWKGELVQRTSEEIQGQGALQGVGRRLLHIEKFRLPGVARYKQLKA